MTDPKWHIGKIRVFDAIKGFGFVKDYSDLNDYFVHISKVLTPVSRDCIVVFQLIPSKKKIGKFETDKLCLLSEFSIDVDFLTQKFSEINDYELRFNILQHLPENNILILAENEVKIQTQISNDRHFKQYLELISKVKKQFENSILISTLNEVFSKHIENISTKEYKIKLWLENAFNVSLSFLEISDYFNSNDDITKLKIYKKVNSSERILLFENHRQIEKQLDLISLLLQVLKIESDQSIIKQLISLTFDKNFFISTAIGQEVIYHEVTLSYKLLPKEIAHLLIQTYHDFTVDFYKMKLWLYGFVHTDTYNLFNANFILLNRDDQIKFIKKLFYLIKCKADKISILDVLSLKNLTFTYREGNTNNLDFSCNIILSFIENIIQGKFLKEEDLFYILTKQIENDTQALLSLSGFFETCNGRKIPDQIHVSEDGIKSIISLKKIPSPKNVEFCEGVKFGDNGKDRTYGHECWWCRGGSCYESNQSTNLPDSYNDYTLNSFLSILNIEVDQRQYFDFLGLLNKINIFIQHLNCRDCNHILKPTNENYNSYYRISNFMCSNSQCDNKTFVYLTHCLSAKKTAINSKCDNLIDSRDTVRCNYRKHNPTERYQEYGPYICNSCGTCCSHKSLEKKLSDIKERNWTMQPGLLWKVENRVGHLEKDETFCYKCGNEMVNNEDKYNEFVRTLDIPNDKFQILRKGANNYGFWYMIKADEDFFTRANEVGLRVSNTNENIGNVKFVAQGNTNFLTCDICSIKYNKKKVEFIPEQNIIEL